MIAQADAIMEQAVATGRFEVVLLTGIMLVLGIGIYFLQKQLIKSQDRQREDVISLYNKRIEDLVEDHRAELVVAREREARMAERIDNLEATVQGKLVELAERQMEVTAKVYEVLRDVTAASKELNGDLSKLVTIMEGNACVLHHLKAIKIVDRETGEEIS
jgi:ribulose 1,5-bisphosphate carboxylase large subunit-like protein